MKVSVKAKRFLNLAAFVLLTVGAVRAAGEVDRTFSAAVQNTPAGSVRTIVRQADGKILAAGRFTVVNNSGRVGLARFNPDGTVDQAFNPPDFYGLSGVGFSIDFASINSIAVQTDGKILIGGNFVRVNTQTASGFLRLNADGSIDTTFNAAGVNSPTLIKVTGDNKILVFHNVTLTRLNTDGSRDTSFQNVVARVSALEVQPDGKILVGTDDRVYRLNSDGSLDISYNQATTQNNNVHKFVLLPNGQILVGGSFRTLNNINAGYIARLNADGTLDTSFNPGGFGTNSTVYAIDVLPDGKIVIGGDFVFFGGIDRRGNARLNSNGTLDTTYSYNAGNTVVYAVVSAGDGKVYLGGDDFRNLSEKLVRVNADGTRDASFDVDFYQPGAITQVLSQPDGKVIITGTFARIYGVERRFIARLNADGSLDAGFNPAVTDRCFGIALQPDGKIFCGIRRLNADGTLDASFQPPAATVSVAYKVLVQPDGKILLGGLFPRPFNSIANVIRLNADGSEDVTLNRIAINQVGNNNTNAISGLKLQADGKIVVTGNFTQISNVNRGRIARFNPDGTIDPTFFSTVGANGDISDLTIQSDGKIVIVGSFSSVNGSGNTFYIARLLPDSTTDMSFVGNPNAPVYAVEKQADGKILIGGFFNAVRGIAHPYLARLNPDGSPDTFGGLGPNDIVSSINLAPGGKIVIGGNFTRVDNFSTVSVARVAGAASSNAQSRYDYDGDGRADVSIFRPSNGVWYILPSQTNGFYGFPFGQAGDLIAPADYDGDGKTDVAVFRPTVPGAGDQAYFYILNSADNSFRAVGFGTNGDVPVSGDWDGDGKADLAVYREATITGGQSNFFYRPSSQPTVNFITIPLGTPGDKPVVGDFDGDGRLDAAVLRVSTATWIIRRSSDNATTQTAFGLSTDIPTPADFDGDGRANIAVFRPSSGTWFTSQNPATNFGAIQFGANGDVPVPADYDGDGRADVAVFRPSNGAWFLNRTTSGLAGVQFGANGDKPSPNAYIR